MDELIGLALILTGVLFFAAYVAYHVIQDVRTNVIARKALAARYDLS